MSVFNDWRDFFNRDCDCTETGYHKFVPYEMQTELLIAKLDELIKLLEDWNNVPIQK